MPHSKSFDQLLDAMEELPTEEQVELVSVMRSRLAERARARLVEEVREGLAEFAGGKCRPKTASEIINGIE